MEEAVIKTKRVAGGRSRTEEENKRAMKSTGERKRGIW